MTKRSTQAAANGFGSSTARALVRFGRTRDVASDTACPSQDQAPSFPVRPV